MAVSLLSLGVFLAGPASAQQAPALPPVVHADNFPAPPAIPTMPRLDPVVSPMQVSVPVASPTPLPVPAQQPVLSERQRKEAEENQAFISLDLPSLVRMTRLESEASLMERMRNEARKGGDRLTFPEEPVLSRFPYPGRHWAPLIERVEPHYVCHGRLYFEQPNSERQGWSLGALQPLVCLAHFYGDVALLPYHIGTRPCQPTECSAGKCLPGDAAPLVWYPPELSVTGLLAQTGAIAGGFFIFP